MRVAERIATEGRQLFRLRSFVPLMLLPALYFALLQMARFETRWGDEAEDRWLAFCVCASGFGLLLRCATVGFVPEGTSGRSRGAPGATELNTLGLYSIVRNPLYLANGIMWLGVALATTSPWFVSVTVLTYWLYIERVIASEEAFLSARFGEQYQEWVGRTPCFLPRPSLWRAPRMRFSVRTVLRREYSGVIAMGIAFTLLEFVSDTFMQGEPILQWLVTDREWVVFFTVTLMTGVMLRVMKKIHWLDVPGR